MVKKDTLVIIGNGFDIWQGLNTSYKDFERYYLAHRDEILRKLWIRKHKIKDGDGRIYEVSDVELIYGNPFEPGNLNNEFWHTFEASLANLDSYRLNLFFGKEKKDIKRMQKSVKNAGRILREAFCSWIKTIKTDNKNSDFRFGDNCVFINFNYTDTLQKCFGVDENDIIYVHGEACDKDSIIFGHAYHPYEPEEVLMGLGPRFQGLYFVESLLYETDKRVKDNITALAVELSLNGVNYEDIKDIYVLGHSFGEVDIEYFEFLTSTLCYSEDYEDSEEDLYNRIQYAVKRYGNDSSVGEPILPEEIKSVQKKFQTEQMYRDEVIKNEYSKALGIKIKDFRTSSSTAKWHISYHTPMDKKRANVLMKLLNCKDYRFYDNIDSAIKNLLVKI